MRGGKREEHGRSEGSGPPAKRMRGLGRLQGAPLPRQSKSWRPGSRAEFAAGYSMAKLCRAGLVEAALAGRRFFHFCAHGVEIVRCRNYREEDDQHACQREQAVQRSQLVPCLALERAAPQPVGGQRQEKPREIEEQFHAYMPEDGIMPMA